MMLFRVFLLVFAVGGVFSFSSVFAAGGQSYVGVSEVIRETLSSKVVSSHLKSPRAVSAFYLERDYKPYWVSKSGIQSKGRDLIAFIEESWSHGLNPSSYNLDVIDKLTISKGEVFLSDLADLDIVLTDAYVRLGRDLTGIRVNPKALNSHRKFWKQPLGGQALLSFLGRPGPFKGLLNSLHPQGQTYTRLRAELRDIVFAPAPAYERVLPLRIKGVLKPYQRHKRVSDLRLRLGLSSDVEDPYFYGDDLAEAVIAFQRENNLKPDGLIGAQTLDILNVTRRVKINQLIANLERLRWVDEDKPDKFVVVNIPSATLWAVEGGQVAFEMPVIVGRKKRPTNIFISEIHGVRFNPTWTVPPTIKREDILPALQADSGYLKQKGMELIMGHGADAVTLDPASIDWAGMNEDDLKYFRMVQIPGTHNPLGQVRVLMPNRYNIYLHDTNHRNYFERASLALSSGCVRMKEPQKMAQFIMKERSGWQEDTMGELLAKDKMRDLYIPRPIPVYLLYYTVWINEQDDLVYGSDLYEYDKKLIKMLSDLDGIFIPVDNNGNMRAI